MDKNLIINKTKEYARITLQGESSGHDWFHVERVWKISITIAEKENADMFVVQLASLLHDIADWKFNDGNENVGAEVASNWLISLGVPNDTIDHVSSIISTISFKGAKVILPMKTLEGMIVQDADRLDAIGAIGIARTFAYGGHKNREMYNPDICPVLHESSEQYKSNTSPTINHFYEKLLLLKDLMNTETAKVIAKDRHEYMESFLERFFKEWEGY